MRTTDTHIYFWSGIYSQWEPATFKIDGITYNCAEQYMMAEKARLFKDDDALLGIMTTESPAQQKAIGRKVVGFNDAEWFKIARLVVYRGTLGKFYQNGALLNKLMNTENRIIVEASPQDKIWGVGLHFTDDKILDEANWQGTNWLGEAIMQVRSDLRTMEDVILGR